ncbi:polysaccharide biosynthesis/export family protein [Acidocella sp.]|uniref:polysaccharide biosynthesis/export family protein n=1 Tax=Acidocella sp. TaxID=50710 RepID=UPI002613CA77|nr:SLBB domain-containing protein [Acidocella sp.]
MRRRITPGAALAALLSLGACASLPESGPRTDAVLHAAGYHLVRLDMATPNPPPAASPARGMAALPPAAPTGRLAPGDEVQITLWEANPTGQTLLTQPALRLSLRVGADGSVALPYLGVWHVAGESAPALSCRIAAAFAAQGHQIQAAVLDTTPTADRVVLAGEAAKPGLYPLAGALTLSALIAEGGGGRGPADETLVRLRRGAHEAEMPLSTLLADPADDIPLAPGDEVTLLPRRRYFYAFGAVNHPGLFPYDAPALSLLTALAEAAGLRDDLAAPRGVFLYRPGPSQTVYQLDLSDPASVFAASRFSLHPGDVLYVSDAPVADAAKILSAITGLGNIAAVPRNFGAPY